MPVRMAPQEMRRANMRVRGRANHVVYLPSVLQTPLPPPNTKKPIIKVCDTPSWFEQTGPCDVSIVIPMFRSREVMEEQIAEWDLFDDGLKKEVIYIDDSCPDESYRQVLKSWEKRRDELKHPIGRILLNQNNSGYGHACNAGAEYARGKYIIFLNADTVVTHNWIRPMYDMMEKDSKIGIVGNMHLKVINNVLTIDSAGSEWLWQTGCFDHLGRHAYHGTPLTTPFALENAPGDLLKPSEREMVTGCCFMMRKDVFLDVGSFDTDYVIGYWEDSDLNMRVKWAGYKVMYQPDSKIYHRVGHSGAGGHSYQTQNRNRFYNKWVKSGVIDSYITNKRPQSFELKTVLVRREAAHGDVLVASAVCGAIKKKHPNCHIIFETALPEILFKNPYIDEITVLNSGKAHDVFYDLDLAYEKRPKVHILRSFADAANVKMEDCIFHLNTETFPNLPARYVVLAASNTLWAGRNWDNEKFMEIVKRLKSRGFEVVSVGNAHDAQKPQEGVIDLRGKTTLHQLAHVIKNSSLFVGNDSLPFWMAQTFKIPGVCFFGSILPEYRIVNDNMLGVNRSDLKCIGCHHEQSAPCVATNNCRFNTIYCEQDLSVEDFWKKVEKFI